ncbi:MAG: glycerol-3-phosphate 1-O-acyltransferase PlsY [Clostridia bacterium]|nr:glycerol-3-phosphate 1-O-acyltransferase PlsY [Clostridia bacterium]
MIFAVLVVIFAYLIGSISFAVVFSKIFMKDDIRTHGSGNAGTTNMMREGGFLPGALTFICDALKGFVACYVGKIVFGVMNIQNADEWAIYGAFICGVACMLGHVFPIFFGFRGGKGIATSVGIFAVCNPIAIAIGLAVFAIIVLVFRYVSVASITAAITVVTLTMVFYNDVALLLPQAVLAVVMGLIVILKHIENIKRIFNGTENKIGTGGKK